MLEKTTQGSSGPLWIGGVVIHGSKCRDMVGGGKGKVDLPRTMNKGWGWGILKNHV